MKGFLLSVVLLIALSLEANALNQCYFCASCSTPFSASSATIVTCNTTGYSCQVCLIRVLKYRCLNAFLNL